jgi:hypothetical protein
VERDDWIGSMQLLEVRITFIPGIFLILLQPALAAFYHQMVRQRNGHLDSALKSDTKVLLYQCTLGFPLPFVVWKLFWAIWVFVIYLTRKSWSLVWRSFWAFVFIWTNLSFTFCVKEVWTMCWQLAWKDVRYTEKTECLGWRSLLWFTKNEKH